ncbi:hypothetical protein SAMN04487788_3287 [Microbacterium testaceum StLB037]|uniref:Uncharacterized protein n=1 Tax=Microbacterium testaceum (strain StLB037) TaxID=979556 RepID=A0A1H0S903_MICTS|nr:hypothetical protein [Microbacterium testaceum]SDP38147.1 hypothetical protein SAMN04487788_3287 [Microbacterium testaceum StLB037]
MNLPDVSAALLRTTDDDFASNLKKRLLALADATEDEAYASRLRLIANGKRPLRTLLHDPQWRESFDSRIPETVKLAAMEPEQRRALDEAVEQARRRTVMPTREEVASDVADVMRRATATRDAINDDERSGWQVVRDTAIDTNNPAAFER